MRVLGSDIVAEARSWLDTPFRHQGRVRGVGVDCAGVVVQVGQALGLVEYDTTNYGRQPVPSRMGEILDRYLVRILLQDVQPGDIYWMRFGDPMHVAIASTLEDGRAGIIHAYSHIGRCVEHGLDVKWRRRIVRAYRYPGVAG